MHTEILTYEADGLLMQGHLFVDGDAGDARPGVLIFPDAFGLGEHVRSRAERLAKLGYIAMACDLHGGGRLLTDIDQTMSLLEPLRSQSKRIQARALGALRALVDHQKISPSRVAAIGYCFGGTMALELARAGSDIAGIVGFHCGLATTEKTGSPVTTRILMCLGADDPLTPLDQRTAFEAEMREAGADWELQLYGGVVHGFTDPAVDKLGRPESVRYDARADGRSWNAMLAFFGELFA